MAKIHNYILILLIMLALACFSAAAQDDEPYTHYNEEFIEGTKLTIEMGVLDKVIFTYYDKNYTFSVMGVGEEASIVRVEKRAFEVVLGGKIFFDFDDETGEDISIIFMSSDDEEGMYKLELFKKVWDVPEPEPEPEEEEPEEDEEEDEPEPEEDEDEEDEPEPESEEEEPEEDEEEKKKSPTGGTIVNITINFTLGEGSLIGLLVISIVVAAGLIAYKKIRAKAKKGSEYEIIHTKKRTKKKKKR